MNILIKLMSIVSLVIAPTLAQMHKTTADIKPTHNTIKTVEVKVLDSDSTETTTTSVSLKSSATQTDALLEALKKDGLIEGNNVKVEVINNKIIINGKALPDDVRKKYDQYFEKGATAAKAASVQ
jgi:K(+)-stimulated pyrophosphate-energized sodium pump